MPPSVFWFIDAPGVVIAPGATTLTFIFLGASSRAKALEKEFTPPLEVQ